MHTPDLVDGRTFDTHRGGLGIRRGDRLRGGHRTRGASASELPTNWSTPASRSGCARAETRQTARARRARCSSTPALPVSEFGTSWPEDVPVQIHAMDADLSSSRTATSTPPTQHRRVNRGRRAVPLPRRPAPFRRPSSPSYDADATALLRSECSPSWSTSTDARPPRSASGSWPTLAGSRARGPGWGPLSSLQSHAKPQETSPCLDAVDHVEDVARCQAPARRPRARAPRVHESTSFARRAHLSSGGGNARVWGGGRLSRDRRLRSGCRLCSSIRR